MTKAFLAFLSVFLLFGCTPNKKDTESLALVGSQKITVGGFRNEIANLPAFADSTYANYDNIAQYLQAKISDMLMVQEARRQGLDKDSEYRLQLSKMTGKLLKDYFYYKEIEKKTPLPTPKDMQLYIDNTRWRWDGSRIKFHHAEVTDSALAVKIYEALLSGANEAKIKEISGGQDCHFSEGRSFVSAFELNNDLANAAFKMSIGQVCKPFKILNSFFIIKLIDRSDGKKIILSDEMLSGIIGYMIAEQKENKSSRLMDSLRIAYNVRVDDSLLSREFKYWTVDSSKLKNSIPFISD